MVTTSQRVFSEPPHRRILRRILIFCLEEHGLLRQVCRNVRDLLHSDLQLRALCFDMMYCLPPSPTSLDGPLPSRANNPRTPLDTENFLREHALQTFSPSLVRCVHARGAIAAVRDGYMASFSYKPGATDKRPTGWTVWALPLWHEARKTSVASRDSSRPVRSDTIDVRDIPLPPRPSGAVKEQAMWMWDFDLGKEIAAIAIHPEDNLIAVAAAPVTVSYAAGNDKRHSDTFRVGRRHRIYFFRLRPPGLGMSYMTEWGRPVKHVEAPRPFVDFIEPVQDPDAHVKYSLKIGSNGLVALLVKPESKSTITSGPLIVWSWRSGSCRGVVSTIPEVARVLDFDFMTDNHVVILEVVPIQRQDTWRRVNLPLIPHRCRLTVVELSSIIPRNPDVVYHSTKQPPSETFHHFLAHNCWTLDDCAEDSVQYVTSLELPPLLDKGMERSVTPASAVFGSVSIYPQLSEDFPRSLISFTVGCKSTSHGVLVSPNQMLRGVVPAEAAITLIPPSVKQRAICTALKKWQRYYNGQTSSPSVLDDHMRKRMEHVAAMKVHDHAADPMAEDGGLLISYDRLFRFKHGARLFQSIVQTADDADIIRLAGGSTKRYRHMSLPEALGGWDGLEANSKLFARLLPPLATSRSAMQPTPFRSWCAYADIEVLSSPAPANAYGCRVAYIDPRPPFDQLRPPTGGEEEADCTASSSLVIRNYSIGRNTPDFANDKTLSPPIEGKTAAPGSRPMAQVRPVRYAQCSCPPRDVHPPWLGERVTGSSHQLQQGGDNSARGFRPVSEMSFCEVRTGVACGRGGVQRLWFDGQTIVLAQGHRATLVCF